MGAVFADLHDVAQVLAEHIREEAGLADVQPGPPRDVSAGAEPGARITFLYATPQPGHRSDPFERLPDGTHTPPPLSLSCFYLVTTSGADDDDPIMAHHALGRIMTLYHDQPQLELPLSETPGAPPDAFSDLGEGQLVVTQVPVTLDQIDKIWTSLDVQLQPWALFEVSPVQLVPQRDDLAPAPVVRPGGIGLEVRAARRPLVTRVTPDVVRAAGRVRIDALLPGDVERVTVDRVEVPAGDASLTIPPTGAPLLLTLDDGGLEEIGEGAHRLIVRASGLVSRRAALRVGAASAPLIDAPQLTHDPADALVLSGQNLGGAQEAVLWPDVGLVAPTDAHSAAVADVSGNSVTVPAAELAALPAGRAPWRLALRIGAQVYTPYVLVELEP